MNRRAFLTLPVVLGASASSLSITPAVSAGHEKKPAFVLIHGAWHGGWAWNDVVPLLMKAGHPVLAVELPGAGTKAVYPSSFLSDPFDAQAYGTEPTSIKDLTQQERTDYVIDAVKAAAESGNGKVVLVGHSLGGLTISPLAEALPDVVQDVVYLTAFLIPDGEAANDALADDSFKAGQLGLLFAADPAKTGTLRINPRSPDPAYAAQARTTFYADVDEGRMPAILGMLHSDEPATVTGVVQKLTPEKYGTVDRHYIVMEDDKTIPAAAQRFMISNMDGSGIGGKTTVHSMSGSHSPFFAQPDRLAETLLSIADN